MITKKMVYLVICSIVLTSTIYSFARSDDNKDPAQRSSIKNENVSGKELYRGFYFGYGTVADNMDTIKKNHHLNNFNLDENNFKKYLEESEKMIHYIDNIDPFYFDQLKEAVYNNDPVEIDNIIYKSTSYLHEYMDKNGIKDFSKNLEMDGTGSCIYIGPTVIAVTTHTVVMTTSIAMRVVAAFNHVALTNQVGAIVNPKPKRKSKPNFDKKIAMDNELLYQKTIEEIITKYGNKYL